MNLIYYVLLVPLLSCLVLIFLQRFFLKNYVSIISLVSIFTSLLLFVCIVHSYCNSFNQSKIFFIPLIRWMTINQYNINLNFLIDVFSLSMLAVVLIIGLCVFSFSCWYMQNSSMYVKYFIYMNLFILFMLVFSLTTNLVTMFCAWELVSVCSYLLIGFYSYHKKNRYFAIKSFLMTRFSDIFFLISIFLIFLKFKTLDFVVLKYYIYEIIFLNNHTNYIFLITFFLTIAAIGKSAQVPLHTWLIGAMVGPTPASALIHAATMIIMGVYLILRVYILFICNSYIMVFLSLIGCLTIIISGISAIFENNIKRILAYSTMSQIGYMFIALGSNNIHGAFIHLICHAFFKSLLFLSVGSIIKCVNGEQNIIKMGGLYKKLPLTYMTFLIGISSLISLPFITSSSYSKSSILLHLIFYKNYFLFLCSLIGIFLTAIYSCRMVFLIFHGIEKSKFRYLRKNFLHNFSLLLLSIGCTSLTWYIISHVFNKTYNLSCIEGVNVFYIEFISVICSGLGLLVSYIFCIRKNFYFTNYYLSKIFYPFYVLIINYWFFDVFYFYIFIQTYCNISYYLNRVNLLYIENLFLNQIFLTKKRVFNIPSVNIIYHVRWYIFCLTIVLSMIFIINNNYI
ncbi:NADH-quinone oxidoreductase subunit L [Buchnera aphidicola]|uniref:NADH-quinone oxidoreductase subunit L n=1 Tax=Buchnera aphidicola (Cinara cf. splendens/pseudotsugae 3390) TaxID=2518980 RepID=A0A451CWT2_9GAMM|nr:NADH-quinone oxidoreductase subunit L [Buchnera aphidicola]VFP77685.1 NADH-quinone oxidoreductase subunit L [Buchnera aphidicola (Cinara cf. splendens/pseudotsugae 3390)]